MAANDQWLTASQVADQLQVSVMTVYRLIKTDLNHYRIGSKKGRLRFKQEDVDAYMRSRREEYSHNDLYHFE